MTLRSSDRDKCLCLKPVQWPGATWSLQWRHLIFRPVGKLRSQKLQFKHVPICPGLLWDMPAWYMLYVREGEINMLFNMKKCAFVLTTFITVWSVILADADSITSLWALVLLCGTCKEIYLTYECQWFFMSTWNARVL